MVKKLKIFADGANIQEIKHFLKNKKIKGFTTNPTLMRKSNVKNYETFSREVSKLVYPKPISLEVFSDNLEEMYKQAKIISNWNQNIYVKIPVINTRGQSTIKIIKKLSSEKIKLNITAIFTKNQIFSVIKNLDKDTKSIISIFAGRIADSGRDPDTYISYALNLLNKKNKKIEVLWASTREPFNIIEAGRLGCHIITVPNDIFLKMKNFKKNLFQFSKETVKMFYDDAKSSGYKIKIN